MLCKSYVQFGIHTGLQRIVLVNGGTGRGADDHRSFATGSPVQMAALHYAEDRTALQGQKAGFPGHPQTDIPRVVTNDSLGVPQLPASWSLILFSSRLRTS